MDADYPGSQSISSFPNKLPKQLLICKTLEITFFRLLESSASDKSPLIENRKIGKQQLYGKIVIPHANHKIGVPKSIWTQAYCAIDKLKKNSATLYRCLSIRILVILSVFVLLDIDCLFKNDAGSFFIMHANKFACNVGYLHISEKQKKLSDALIKKFKPLNYY